MRQPVFIVGGGKSADQLDLNKLPDIGTVIAINDCCRYISNASWAFTADAFWLSRRQKVWREFAGNKVAALPIPWPRRYRLDLTGTELVRRITGVGVSSDPGAVYFGDNSGFAALNWVITKGMTDIALVGFDMNEPRALHWHGGYEWNSRIGPERYPGWIKAFRTISPEVVAKGIRVRNLNRKSGISCFEFCDLSDFYEGVT